MKAAIAAKQGFEKIAEFAAAAAFIEVCCGIPARRWRELPVTAHRSHGLQLIVFLAFGRILQDFIGLAKLLEFLLGIFFLADVGMIFARKPLVGFFDFIRGSFLCHSQDFVIVF